MQPNPHFLTDLTTFTEEILNGKLHFLPSLVQALLPLWVKGAPSGLRQFLATESSLKVIFILVDLKISSFSFCSQNIHTFLLTFRPCRERT